MSIGRLREVAARLGQLEDGGGEPGRWLANVLMQYQAGARHGLTLDQCAGLVPAPGTESWWRSEDRQRRDQLLRAIAARWFGDEPSRRRQAAAIAARLRRYEASATWRRDRVFLDPPLFYRGTMRELLFRVLKCGPAPSARTIERVLSSGVP